MLYYSFFLKVELPFLYNFVWMVQISLGYASGNQCYLQSYVFFVLVVVCYSCLFIVVVCVCGWMREFRVLGLIKFVCCCLYCVFVSLWVCCFKWLLLFLFCVCMLLFLFLLLLWVFCLWFCLCVVVFCCCWFFFFFISYMFSFFVFFYIIEVSHSHKVSKKSSSLHNVKTHAHVIF